jgi:hypothetical protein
MPENGNLKDNPAGRIVESARLPFACQMIPIFASPGGV